MKHKVSDLEGALLDAAVAKAEGPRARKKGDWMTDVAEATMNVPKAYRAGPVAYSSDWQHGGPIIERERIAVYFQTGVGMENDFENEWVAGTGLSLETTPEYDSGGGFPFIDFDHSAAGPTPLIAAMRAYVASKLGEEVEL